MVDWVVENKIGLHTMNIQKIIKAWPFYSYLITDLCVALEKFCIEALQFMQIQFNRKLFLIYSLTYSLLYY